MNSEAKIQECEHILILRRIHSWIFFFPAASLCSVLTVSVFETSTLHNRFNLSLSSIFQATFFFFHFSTGGDQDRIACHISSTILSIFPYRHMHLISRQVTTSLVNFFCMFLKFAVFWVASQPTVCLYPNAKCRNKWQILHFTSTTSSLYSTRCWEINFTSFSAIFIMWNLTCVTPKTLQLKP
jgi:hypothetical protein